MKQLLNRSKSLIWPLRILAVLLLGLLTYQYFPVHWYHFPESTPFEGELLYNPYANLKGNWLKGNFHTHAHAWGGLTNGHQSGQEIIARYQELGYEVITMSDYYRINPDMQPHAPIYIPVYEHGSDIRKTHRLVIGTEEIDFYDLLYSPNRHFKQYLIEHVNRRKPALVAINHPSMRNGHPAEVLRHLTGYDLIEVLNRHRLCTTHWDSALSHGKPVWIIANDDLHDLDHDIPGFAWTMMNGEPDANGVLNALKLGQAYGVRLRAGLSRQQEALMAAKDENFLEKVTTQEMTATWKLSKPAKSIRLFGQNGSLLKETENTDSISYTFEREDTYARAEITTENTWMYLNPIIRTSSALPPDNRLKAKINHPLTFIYRVAIVFFDLIALWFIGGKGLQQRIPLPVSLPRLGAIRLGPKSQN